MRMSRSLRFAATLALTCLSASLVTACGDGDGGGGLFGDDLTTDPDALLAAETAGNASAGLEVVLVGAGLLTEIPLGMLPEEAVQVAATALDELLSSCLDANALTGDATGLSLQFAQGGCGIPNTNINLQGAFSFQSSATDDSSAWALDFTGFQVAGVAVDGAIDIAVVSGQSLDFQIDDLDVEYGGTPIKVDALGDLDTNTAHTDITFSGNGAVTWDGTTYALEIANLERHLTSDCYPEVGRIAVTIARAGQDPITASVEFEDDALGLDSDDSGKVYVTIAGEKHTAKVPSRNCSGF